MSRFVSPIRRLQYPWRRCLRGISAWAEPHIVSPSSQRLTLTRPPAYYQSVPVRNMGRPPRRSSRGPNKAPVGVVFWLGFFIFILLLFLANWKSIQISIKNTGFLERMMNGDASGAEGRIPPSIPPEVLAPPQPAAEKSAPALQPNVSGEHVPVQQAPAVEAPSVKSEPLAQSPPPAQAVPVAPAAQAASSSAVRETPPRPAESLNERAFYLMQVDREGVILRTRVTRRLPASDAPLLDVLRVLLDGPSEDEQRRGLITLIPQGTRVNNVIIRGSTAYINLSEEFQFNTYGIEGYMGSLRQVVWTVTELSAVADVQILIDGRRVDYLGESIWLGGPLSRELLQE